MIKSIKILELFLLGLLFPFLIVFYSLSKYVLIYLWCIFLYAIILYFSLYYKKKMKNVFGFWNKKYFKYYLIIIFRWLICSLFLYFLTLYLFPEKLFLLLEDNRGLLYKIFLFYPLFSALPQEFIFWCFIKSIRSYI